MGCSFLKVCLLAIIGCCGAFPAIYMEHADAKKHLAVYLVDCSEKLNSKLLVNGPELIIIAMEVMVAASFVLLGLCIFVFLLWGLYHITKRVQAFHTQQARAVKRGLKAWPFIVHQASTPQPQFSSWIIATLLIIAALPPIILLQLFHPLLPTAPVTHLPQPLHNPASALTLPLSYQPAYAQWFEPAKRDHVYWLEDLGSVVSVSAKASWDFWTLQLPTVPESNNTQHQPRPAAPRRPSTDFFHWAWPNATCPDPRYLDDQHLSVHSVHNINDAPVVLPTSADLCMGAVWRATDNFNQFIFKPIDTSTAAAATAAAVPRPDHIGNSNQLYLPADTSTAAAATAVAVFRLYHAVGIHDVAALPTAVILGPTTATCQTATLAAEMSTAVAVYRSTRQPTTPLVNDQPLSISGSTAVATLVRSTSPMESASISTRHMINNPDQITDPAAISTSMNQSTTCTLLELIGTNTSIDPTPQDSRVSWLMGLAKAGWGLMMMMQAILHFVFQLALLSLLLFVISCFQYRVPRTNREISWELIEVIDLPKARARRGYTAQCGKSSARISNRKTYDITAAAKPQMHIPCVADSSIPCQRQVSQQAEEVQRGKHASRNSSANIRTILPRKQRVRHKIKAAKASFLKAICCQSRVVD